MKKFEITFSREITSRVLVERETLAEAIELIESEFEYYGSSNIQEVKTVGKPIIKAVVEVNSKQRLDEG